MKPFLNRQQAGEFLAEQLQHYTHNSRVLVLGLPRGGVPVAYEISRSLDVPLDVFIVRKLGFPGHEEFAIGAIASGGVRVLNQAALKLGRLSEEEIDAVAARELQELHRRELLYRGNRPPPDIEGKTGILVDDGLATGSTMRAAIEALRQLHPAKIVVAVPVASQEACAALREEADEVVCLHTPENFYAVGQWYRNFSQTTDEEVQQLLAKDQSRHKQEIAFH